MGLPDQPVTLSVEQVEELNQKLSTMRHDINNHLSMVVAAVELIQMKPDSAPRMIERLAEQPAKITEAVAQFSREFESSFGIRRR